MISDEQNAADRQELGQWSGHVQAQLLDRAAAQLGPEHGTRDLVHTAASLARERRSLRASAVAPAPERAPSARAPQIITTRPATADDVRCPRCDQAIRTGQRIALTRDDDGHAWIHVRHLAEPQPDHDDGQP